MNFIMEMCFEIIFEYFIVCRWHALELPLSYQNELHRFMNACTLDADNILFPSVRHTKLLAVATALL